MSAKEAGAKEQKAEKKAQQKPEKKSYPVPRLKTLFREKILKELMDEFNYDSSMRIPRLQKVVVSMGVGEAIQNKKLLDSAVQELSQITGQSAVKTKARKSIASFKLREGMEIGTMVTLRGDRMY